MGDLKSINVSVLRKIIAADANDANTYIVAIACFFPFPFYSNLTGQFL